MRRPWTRQLTDKCHRRDSSDTTWLIRNVWRDFRSTLEDSFCVVKMPWDSKHSGGNYGSNTFIYVGNMTGNNTLGNVAQYVVTIRCFRSFYSPLQGFAEYPAPRSETQVSIQIELEHEMNIFSSVRPSRYRTCRRPEMTSWMTVIRLNLFILVSLCFFVCFSFSSVSFFFRAGTRVCPG